MRRILVSVGVLLVFNSILSINQRKITRRLPEKTVDIRGAFITPTRKGMLCINYKNQGEKASDCQAIAAGSTYRFIVPHKVNRITVTRSFDNLCTKNRKGKMSCKTLRGHFNVPYDVNTLILKHEHNIVHRASGRPITHGYEPRGNLGTPTWFITQPSVRFDRIYNGDPWSIY